MRTWLCTVMLLLLAACTRGESSKGELRLEVDTGSDVHPISPLIYGTNSPEPRATRYGLLRLGGNRLTAYNWENNASNAGSDWHFQNDGLLSASDVPGAALAAVIGKAHALGAATLLTVPIVDHVSADKGQDGDVRKSGADYLQKRFRKNVAKKPGALAAEPDLTDDSVYQDEMVAWVKANFGDRRVLFSLDNEPELWSHTHAEVHPKKVEYQELCTRSAAFGEAVKRAWPEAEVTGFVSYGWNGFKNLQDAPDRAGKGEFLDYWLDCMKAAEAKAGRRLVDYLDVHWYPEATGGGTRITENDARPEVVAARLQAPRSLWEEGYVEKSWVAGKFLPSAVKLIPRLKERIKAHYPGTRLAVTEWNYGAGDSISGALATADVLGVFGREGVDLAAYWSLTRGDDFAQAAFLAYRDLDGQGAAFGDTSVRATSSDLEGVTVYAATQTGAADRVTIVAINKTPAARPAQLAVKHKRPIAALRTARLTADAPKLVAADEVKSDDGKVFRLQLPPMSITVLWTQP
jgi:Glycoside hydrolase family 44